MTGHSNDKKFKQRKGKYMGVDIEGKMILGNTTGNFEIDVPDDIHEWAEDNDLDYASPHYDASPKECVFGFKIEDIEADNMTIEWLNDIQFKAEKFKQITGCSAILYGMQHVW